jgi:hypothetical protein
MRAASLSVREASLEFDSGSARAAPERLRSMWYPTEPDRDEAG